MSVLVVTSLGNLVFDLFVDECPIACKNFLKLCKLKYYNNVLFYNVQENFIIQSGDPTGTGEGGMSVYGLLYGDQAKYFEDELSFQRKYTQKGLVSMANSGPNTNTSQFFITARDSDLEHLDGKHSVFAEVAEGLDVLDKMNTLYVDPAGRPYQDIRILHTYVLEDPYPDPPTMPEIPPSPTGDRPELETVAPRLAADEKLDDHEGRTEEEIEQSLKEKEAKSRAVVLEMIGDIPDADVKPPEEVLFICKLNPVTTDEDLELIFSRFGPCKCEIIKDYKTADSLCYGFVEFMKREHCEEAYFKMNNVLVDERRIKVDFSQSVSKLWNRFSRKEHLSSQQHQNPYDLEKNSSVSNVLDKKTTKRKESYDILSNSNHHSSSSRGERRDEAHDNHYRRKRQRSNERNSSTSSSKYYTKNSSYRNNHQEHSSYKGNRSRSRDRYSRKKYDDSSKERRRK